MDTRFTILRVPISLLRAAGLVCVLAIVGCERKASFSQSTPDQALQSAVAMVKSGQARRLTSLVYAESPQMREVLERLGELLGHLQVLSASASRRFPEEFEQLRERAVSGEGGTLLSSLVSGTRVKGGTSDPLVPDKVREWVNGFLADPYGWFDRNAARLTTSASDDTSAFVLLDGQPAIPVVGLTMRLDGGRWYFVLPTGVPPISGYMPRSRQQWSIVGSLIRIMDRGVAELTEDVDAGRVSGLDDLASRAQDKMLMPGMIAFTAYGRELDVRQRIDRRVTQFETRKMAWARARRETGGGGAISTELLAVMSQLAGEQIERAVRTKQSQAFAEMGDADFEAMVGAWCAERGLGLNLAGDLSGATVDAAIKAWQKRPAPVLAKRVRGGK